MSTTGPVSGPPQPTVGIRVRHVPFADTYLARIPTPLVAHAPRRPHKRTPSLANPAMCRGRTRKHESMPLWHCSPRLTLRSTNRCRSGTAAGSADASSSSRPSTNRFRWSTSRIRWPSSAGSRTRQTSPSCTRPGWNRSRSSGCWGACAGKMYRKSV